jgi:3-deoxy-manno-octulosonate cytidylyltransferase (CMP-KDO synthetase)
MKILCVIPARYSSTRLPGKPLAMIAGKTMIQRVYERAAQATKPDEVLVATDDERIKKAVEGFGGKAMMTSASHPSGTDRLAEVALSYDQMDVIINVQGDEPMIPPTLIDELCQAFEDNPQLQMATAKTLMQPEDYKNPNAVKVVTDQSGYALYFSRSLIPYPRYKTDDFKVYKHIGIYAYRRDFLLKFAALLPTTLEQIEGLEQLRAMENGTRIKVLLTDFQGIGIDTQEDLDRANKVFAEMEAEKAAKEAAAEKAAQNGAEKE